MTSPASFEASQLLALVERVERLESDKKDVTESIKDVYSEARNAGYDVKILRKVVSLRKQDKDKRSEEREILNLYLNALGMLADLPLGMSAVERAFGKAA